MKPMPFVYSDGGRLEAHYLGETSDCVCRAVAIATELPYATVYAAINMASMSERPRNGRKRSSAGTGVAKRTTRTFLESIGWTWTPTMGIGTGCKVHLAMGELPMGRLVVSVSRHIVAVGVLCMTRTTRNAMVHGACTASGRRDRRMVPDFQVENYGASVVLLRPMTQQARVWCDRNLHVEGWQRLGGAVAVEPRCLQAIIDGAASDGLAVSL